MVGCVWHPAARKSAAIAASRQSIGLKPDFARIYAETYSQDEIDGLIAFYGGPLGAALISKMPQLLNRSIQLMQERMAPMLQQVAQVTKEEIEKERSRGSVRN